MLHFFLIWGTRVPLHWNSTVPWLRGEAANSAGGGRPKAQTGDVIVKNCQLDSLETKLGKIVIFCLYKLADSRLDAMRGGNASHTGVAASTSGNST